MISVQTYYRKRFSSKENINRDILWRLLCSKQFQMYVNQKDTVMDIGAGYCEFINHIQAKKKIAVDINPDTQKNAQHNIEVLLKSAERIPSHYDGTIDIIFMSNFLEHLSSKEQVIKVLHRAFHLLKPKGKLIVLQPNIDLVGGHYWDFFDHIVPLNGESLQEGLRICGFTIEKYIVRFFSYTTKSAMLFHPLLVQFYLMVPPVFRPFAGQSLFIARK